VNQAVKAALGDRMVVADAPDASEVAALRAEYGLDAGESEAIIARRGPRPRSTSHG